MTTPSILRTTLAALGVVSAFLAALVSAVLVTIIVIWEVLGG